MSMKRLFLRFFQAFFLALPLLLSCGKDDSAPAKEQTENTGTTGDAFPAHDDYRIYVIDETGWDAIALYMWGAVNDLGGKWPGIQPWGKVTVKGQEYTWFPLKVEGAYGMAEHLIFNNNNGGAQLADVALTFGTKADYFFRVKATGATAFDGGSTLTVEVDNGPIRAAATKLTDLEAAQRNAWSIYQVNPKLYGASGAFGKIQARLDDIAALGIDVLYLMPIYKEGKLKSIGSPYCIGNLKELNSAFGTLDELKVLVDAAHGKGMKVILDWVANHTAWDSPWITAHKDWYAQDASGNIVCPTADGTWSDVAQLNYKSAELRAEMADCMRYWMETAGIDGFRCDYAHGPTGSKTGDLDAFWKEAISALRADYPSLIMLAESDFPKMFDDGFDIIFSRASKSRLITAFSGGSVSSFFSTYKSALSKATAPSTILLYVTNHDDASETSPVTEFHSKEGALAAFVLMRALNTSTLLYGSQEVGFAGTIDFCKTQTFSWTSQPDYFSAYKQAMTALATLKRDQAAQVYAAGPFVMVVYPDAAVLVNTSERVVEATLPAALSGKSFRDGVTGKTVSLPSELKVEGFSWQILL